MARVHKRRYNLNHLPKLISLLSNSINLTTQKDLFGSFHSTFLCSFYRVQSPSFTALLIEFNWFLSDILFCYSFFFFVLSNRRCDQFYIFFHFSCLWESKYFYLSTIECVERRHSRCWEERSTEINKINMKSEARCTHKNSQPNQNETIETPKNSEFEWWTIKFLKYYERRKFRVFFISSSPSPDDFAWLFLPTKHLRQSPHTAVVAFFIINFSLFSIWKIEKISWFSKTRREWTQNIFSIKHQQNELYSRVWETKKKIWNKSRAKESVINWTGQLRIDCELKTQAMHHVDGIWLKHHDDMGLETKTCNSQNSEPFLYFVVDVVTCFRSFQRKLTSDHVPIQTRQVVLTHVHRSDDVWCSLESTCMETPNNYFDTFDSLLNASHYEMRWNFWRNLDLVKIYPSEEEKKRSEKGRVKLEIFFFLLFETGI